MHLNAEHLAAIPIIGGALVWLFSLDSRSRSNKEAVEQFYDHMKHHAKDDKELHARMGRMEGEIKVISKSVARIEDRIIGDYDVAKPNRAGGRTTQEETREKDRERDGHGKAQTSSARRQY